MLTIDYLILSPNFHRYGETLSDQICELGHNSICLTYRQGGQYSLITFLKVILKYFNRLTIFSLIWFGFIKVRKIIVIKGDFLKREQLFFLKQFSGSIYLWLMDPIERLKLIDLQYYTSILTFDKKDASTHAWHYLPLFSSFRVKKVITNRSRRKILFVGSIYGNRLAKILSLSEELPEYIIEVWGGFSVFKIQQYLKLKKKLRHRANIKIKFGIIDIRKFPMLAKNFDYIFNSIPMDQNGFNMRYHEAITLGLHQIVHKNDQLIRVHQFNKIQLQDAISILSKSYLVLNHDLLNASTVKESALKLINIVEVSK